MQCGNNLVQYSEQNYQAAFKIKALKLSASKLAQHLSKLT